MNSIINIINIFKSAIKFISFLWDTYELYRNPIKLSNDNNNIILTIKNKTDSNIEIIYFDLTIEYLNNYSGISSTCKKIPIKNCNTQQFESEVYPNSKIKIKNTKKIKIPLCLFMSKELESKRILFTSFTIHYHNQKETEEQICLNKKLLKVLNHKLICLISLNKHIISNF